jgi:peptidoglycan hydrolase-like protein with peptidoglycan-binding domain
MALKPGDRGNAVKAVQRALNKWQPNLGVLEDGIYGPGLTAAVKAYQESANLPQSGDVDGVTAALLLTVPVRV